MRIFQGILCAFLAKCRLDKLFKGLWLSVCLVSLVVPVAPALAAATVTTTTTLASGTNPVAVGSATLLTASVTGTAPTGTVTFKSGTTTLGTGTLSGTGNTRTATFSTSFTTTGAKSLTAVYGGDTVNKTSTSSALSETVNKANSTTAVASSLNPSTTGASVTFTATVVGFTPSGTVTFKDGTTTLGTGTLSGTGNTRTATFASSTLSIAGHSITAVYAGDTLNNTSTSSALSQVVNAVATTTALTSNANPATFGQSVTLTATVTGTAPAGTVTFKDGATTLGTGTLSGTGNSRTATFASSALSVASHSITAVYGGDANNATSTSSAVAQVVNPVVSSVALVSSANPSTFGASVTLSATVTGQSPSGTVTFKDGATTLGTGTVNAGVASFATSTLSVASHNITAIYGGDVNNAASTSSAVSQVVNQAVSTTTLASSANPSTFGQSVTLTATVSGNSPTGSVTFKDGATTLGTGTLTAGVATFAVNTLVMASHNLTAVYGGDGNNAGSTSSALAQVVYQAATTIALTSSANPYTLGQSVTLTATLSGGSNPSGSVSFMDGATTLGSAAINAGVASFTTSALGAASHSITAVYAGDGNNAGSTSTAVVQVVNQATSTTALTSSANPSTFGASVTLTATVTGQTPSGTVTFKDGATTLGGGTVSAGVATLNTTTLGAGSHNLTAVYGGDASNATSTSAAVVQSVTLAATATTLSATPNPATFGQNVTLTASISGNGLTGSVTFLDGGATIGTATVSGAGATLSLNAPAQGSHSITAVYSGDSNNASSNSNAVSLTINAQTAMTWQYGYDAMGRLTTVVDPNGLTSYIYYDSLGRAIQTQQPPNTASSIPTVTGMSYDLADSLTSVTDPRNLITSYSPNGLGQVTAQTSPDTGASQFTYDANGNRLTSVDARGKTTSYAYDVLNRLTTVSFATGAPVTLEYDGGATPIPAEKGELTRMTDESGQTSYSHDALGRLITKTVTVNGKTFITSYSWGDTGSALDKLTAITYPSGSRVNYSYDAQGYLSAISVNPANPNGVGTGSGSSPLLSTITYNAENKITGWLWMDGKARTIGYNSVGMVSSYTLGDPMGMGSAAGVLRSVNRDPAGRINGYSHVNNGTPVTDKDQSFGYDNLNRLLSASLTGTGITTLYSYDETGNRTSKTVGATTYSNTIASDSNRLTQTQDVGGTATIQYDAAGHITGDGTNSFTYSDRGRMSSAVTAGGTVNYLYNGLGQRVGKSGPTAVVPTGAAYYAYDEEGQLLGEYDANGVPIYETVYLGTLPVGVMKQRGSAATSDIAVNLYNVNADHIATPRIITRQDETIVWRWDSAEAFGGTAPEQDPSGLGVFVYNQRFPGQVFDAETALFQNWNREYNARQGRYIQSDPIGLRGGINTFAYVGGNPLRYTDPKGLNTTLMVLGIGAIGAGGLAACNGDPNCRQQMQQLAQQCVNAIGDALGNAVDRFKNWMNSEGAGSPVPENVGPGPNAGDSVPAGPSPRPTKEQRDQINDIGDANGCHTCGTSDPGTKSGNWVGDHQPPTRLNPDENPQSYYPQCLGCSNVQGGRISGLVR